MKRVLGTYKVVFRNDKAQIVAPIPPTLRRLEKAAMVLHHRGPCSVKLFINLTVAFNRACAAHAEWKAKQKGKGK